MFYSPQIAGQLVRERQQEMLARAEQLRTVRQLAAESRATRRASRARRAGLRLRRAQRIARA